MLTWVPNNGWEVGCSLGYQIMDKMTKMFTIVWHCFKDRKSTRLNSSH